MHVGRQLILERLHLCRRRCLTQYGGRLDAGDRDCFLRSWLVYSSRWRTLESWLLREGESVHLHAGRGLVSGQGPHRSA